MKQPIAWAFEETEYGDRTYEKGWQRRVSFDKPSDHDTGVRNVIPLYADDDDNTKPKT